MKLYSVYSMLGKYHNRFYILAGGENHLRSLLADKLDFLGYTDYDVDDFEVLEVDTRLGVCISIDC